MHEQRGGMRNMEALAAPPSLASEQRSAAIDVGNGNTMGKNTETIETVHPREFPWFTFQNSAIVYFPFPTVVFISFLTRRV